MAFANFVSRWSSCRPSSLQHCRHDFINWLLTPKRERSSQDEQRRSAFLNPMERHSSGVKSVSPPTWANCKKMATAQMSIFFQIMCSPSLTNATIGSQIILRNGTVSLGLRHDNFLDFFDRQDSQTWTSELSTRKLCLFWQLEFCFVNKSYSTLSTNNNKKS